jgi:hypothetical protein
MPPFGGMAIVRLIFLRPALAEAKLRLRAGRRNKIETPRRQDFSALPWRLGVLAFKNLLESPPVAYMQHSQLKAISHDITRNCFNLFLNQGLVRAGKLLQ